MIEARGRTRKYGDRVALSNLSFTVRAGTVTGFLGPNGAGKSTTMRMILGLDRPPSAQVAVNGRPFADLPTPISVVGDPLDAKAIQTSRSAYDHLRAIAATHGIPTPPASPSTRPWFPRSPFHVLSTLISFLFARGLQSILD